MNYINRVITQVTVRYIAFSLKSCYNNIRNRRRFQYNPGGNRMNSFGQRLKALRKEAGVSQSFVDDHIGVSTQSVSNWECDNTMPDISQIVPLLQ